MKVRPLSLVLLVLASIFSTAIVIIPLSQNAHAAISIDGSGCSNAITSGNTLSCSITTSNANDIILVNVGTLMGFNAACNGAGGGIITVSTITVGGSSATFRQSKTQNAACIDTEEWYFVLVASGVNTVSVTLSGSIATAGDAAYLTAFAITGLSTSSPFDPNGSAKCGASGSGTSTGCAVTTTNANDILVGANAMYVLTMAAGSGFTSVNTGSNANGEMLNEYKIVSATQSGTSVNWTWTGSQNYDLIADALSAPVTATLPVMCTLAVAGTTQVLSLTGGSPAPNPSTANCSTAGTTTNVVVQISTTITATAPGCTAQTCYYFLSGNSWSSTATKLSCASGTCPTWVLTLYALSPAGPIFLGNCPGTKNNTQITMTNNTVYISSTTLGNTGQILGGQGINTINSFEISVASVSSTTAQEPLYWGLYITPGPGGVSAGNPMGLIASGSVSLTAGTKNTIIQTYGFINYFSSFSGGTIALALEGNSKIILNGSQPKFSSFGTPQPTLPPFSTTVGSTLKIGLFACALLYTVPQEVTTTTVSTTTTTSTSTSFGQTVTTTSTNLVNTPPPTSNWFLASFYLMLPVAFTLTMVLIIEAVRRIRD